MKLKLCAFEQVSRLKINFHKSELYCFGEAQDSIDANLVNSPYDILVSPYTIENFEMRTGRKLRNISRQCSVVGRANTSQLEEY
jgi:transcription termination factor Rho